MRPSAQAASARASVRAYLPASASRGANGEPPGNSRANRTFHGQTSWDGTVTLSG
jgi:hypothetical protein